MIRALALILASLTFLLGVDASKNPLNKSKGKAHGLRADLCVDEHHENCHSFFLQNRSNAIV